MTARLGQVTGTEVQRCPGDRGGEMSLSWVKLGIGSKSLALYLYLGLSEINVLCFTVASECRL